MPRLMQSTTGALTGGQVVEGAKLSLRRLRSPSPTSGQRYSGQATDPNTAPVVALMAIAILGGRRTRVGARVGERELHSRSSDGLSASVREQVWQLRAGQR